MYAVTTCIVLLFDEACITNNSGLQKWLMEGKGVNGWRRILVFEVCMSDISLEVSEKILIGNDAAK
jgi:hypothetical protein